MKAQDYRIGNLVQIDYDDRVFEIHTISDTYPTLNTPEFGIGVVEWYNIKPIKITEYWLLNFGFELNEDEGDVKYYEKNTIGIKMDDCLDFYCYIKSYKSNSCFFVKQLEFVHELQNLFYALTKEELKINIV
jgi:hypothetical protein